MKKRIFLAAVILVMTCVSACGKGEEGQEGASISEPLTEELSSEEGAPAEAGEDNSGEEAAEGEGQSQQKETENTGAQQAEGGETQGKADGVGSEFGFEKLSGWVFYFSSGAGAWYTELSISGDGTFKGHYQDADMGDTGEGYPGGTLYYSDFTGRFEQLEKIDEFTYKMQLTDLDFERQPEQEEIIDEILYVYSTAYGVDGGDEFYLYLPGAKVADLPEEYRQWVGYYNLEAVTETELSFYGLYNIKEQNGFSSNLYEEDSLSGSLSERIAAEIHDAEERDEELEAKAREAVTQTDMNLAEAEILKNWDDTLNTVWGMLMSELDAKTAEALKKEELAWIAAKDAEVAEAGKECEGGSIQPLIEASMAAELTRERVYELAKYAK